MFATAFCRQAHSPNDSPDTILWLTLLATAIAMLDICASSCACPLSEHAFDDR
jgi:hypothetical protein